MADITLSTILGQSVTLTGNVTGTGTGTISTTIGSGVVTLANMANVATGTVFYRKTAGTGSPEVQTLATLKADLGLTGTNSGDQTITLTGNVTGSGTGSFATTIAAGVVTLANMANVASGTVFYRKTAATGVPEVQTLATLKTDLGLTGTNSGDQTITLTSDVTGSGTGSFATTIAAGAVTLGKMANLAANSIIGNNTGSAATPLALTAAQVRTLINVADGATANTGTVTAVSIATANGVSGSSSGGATPALTITLGAITPSTIAATGAITTDGGSFTSTTTSSILAATGSGTIYLRPNGVGSTTAQATYSSAGTFTAVELAATSDARLKTVTGPLEVGPRLSPMRYMWNESGKFDFGFVAQVLEADYPECVTANEDGIKAVSYGKLTAVLASQLNDANDRIAALEAKVAALMEKL